ncbi:MAG: DUF4129 domain-containing protein [Pseudomonadota bacterium]
MSLTTGSYSRWDQEMLRLLYMAMETTWLAGALLVADAAVGKGDGFSLVWLLAAYPPAYWLIRLGGWLGWTLKKCGVMAIVLFVLASMAVAMVYIPAGIGPSVSEFSVHLVAAIGRSPGTLRLAVALLPLLGLVMSRGWVLGLRQVEGKDFIRGFRFGLAAMAVMLLFADTAGVAPGTLTVILTCLFAVGLLGMGLSRRFTSGAKSQESFNGILALALPLSIAVVLVAGFAGFIAIDRQFLEYLLQPVFHLWDLLVRLLVYISGLFPDIPPLEMTHVKESGIPMPAGAGGDTGLGLNWIKPLGNIMFFGGSGVLLLGFLFRVLGDLVRFLRRTLDMTSGISVDRLNYGLWDDLKFMAGMLAAWPLAVLQYLAGIFSRTSPCGNRAELIRRTYLRFLKLGTARAIPRSAGQTPWEYMAAVLPLLTPAAGKSLTTMTALFMTHRYSRATPGAREVLEMKQCWRRVRKNLRRLDKAEPGVRLAETLTSGTVTGGRSS